MKRTILDSTLAALGGAGLGAAIMYLFDPEQGNKRRTQIKDVAGDALSSTGDVLSSSLHSTSHGAHDVAGKIAEYARGLSSTVMDKAESLHQSARHSAGNASDSAASLADRAAQSARSIWANAKSQASDRLPHFQQEKKGVGAGTIAGVSAGAIGALALGAGLMYFLDPQKGRARRAYVSDQLTSATRRTGKAARSYGRHARNRLHGVAHEAAKSLPEMPSMSDVRAKVGQAVDKAKQAVSSHEAETAPTPFTA